MPANTDIPPMPTPPRISRAAFADPALEERFFQHNLHESAGIVRRILLVSCLAFFLTIGMDLMFHIPSAPVIIPLRILVVAGGLVTVLRIDRFHRHRTYTRVISILELSAVGIAMWSTREYDTASDPLLLFIGLLIILLVQYFLPLGWRQSNFNAAISIALFVLLHGKDLLTLPLLSLYFCLMYLVFFVAGFSYFSYTVSTFQHKDYLDNNRLVKLAVTDPLTGIYNRAKFDETLPGLPDMLRDHGMSSVIAFFDFDNFKQINDTHGHQKGDDVIVETVHLVQSLIRRRDIFCRWGGEEFTILFPDTGLEEAVAIVERIRERIATFDYGLGRPVTASFGVAILKPGESTESLLHRVDALLYQAKQAGKNRTEWAAHDNL